MLLESFAPSFWRQRPSPFIVAGSRRTGTRIIQKFWKNIIEADPYLYRLSYAISMLELKKRPGQQEPISDPLPPNQQSPYQHFVNDIPRPSCNDASTNNLKKNQWEQRRHGVWLFFFSFDHIYLYIFSQTSHRSLKKRILRGQHPSRRIFEWNGDKRWYFMILEYKSRIRMDYWWDFFLLFLHI